MQSSTVPFFGTGTPAFFTAASRSAGVISAFGAMWRRSMQMPGTMQFSSGYSLIGVRVLAEMARRVDVGAAVVGHGEEHHAVALDVAGIRRTPPRGSSRRRG